MIINVKHLRGELGAYFALRKMVTKIEDCDKIRLYPSLLQ